MLLRHGRDHSSEGSAVRSPALSCRPPDVLRLLHDKERIRFACDAFANSRFWHADARTRGADGKLVATELASRAAVEAYAAEVTSLLALPIPELEVFVQRDPRIGLLVRRIRTERPWDEPGAPRKAREIVVPTVLRRCVSNLLAEVLEDTADGILPSNAWAYRPGRRDAVVDAILSTASDIHFGKRVHVARYDVSDAFASLPWSGVEQALLAVGYPPPFVAILMAFVRAPRVRLERGGKLQVVGGDRGCGAGLPESAILMNLFFRPLDLAIATRFPSVGHPRYSDDGLLSGARRDAVVGAFRTVQRFMTSHGLSLKGVQPAMRATTAVRDLRTEPVQFLGTTIHADGDVQVSRPKLERQLRKLLYLRSRVPTALGAPETSLAIVAGRSVYAGGRPLKTYDFVDIQRCLLQLFLYCRALNEGQAVIFLRRAERELQLQLQRSPRHLASLVWVAALGHQDAPQAGDQEVLRSMKPSHIEQWFRALMTNKATPLPDGIGDGVMDVMARNPEAIVAGSASPIIESDGALGRREKGSSEAVVPCGGRVLIEGGGEPNPQIRSKVCESELLSSRFSLSSESERIGADVLVDMNKPRAKRASPALGPVENARVVHVVARRFARRNARGGGTVVGIQVLGASSDGAVLRLYRRAHESGAVVEAVHALADENGQHSLVVLLETSDLPKQLLQSGRSLRKPSFYARVLALHGKRRTLVVAGPWAAPASLVRSVADACAAASDALPKYR